MMDVMNGIEAAFGWTLANSWRAAALVVVVLAVQRAGRNRIAPRWQYALWFVVAARLVMPAGLEHQWSVFNWAPGLWTQEQRVEDVYSEPALPIARVAYAPIASVPMPAAAYPGPSADVMPPVPAAESGLTRERILAAIPFVWLTGAALLALLMIAANFQLLRKVRRQTVVTDAAALTILESCKAQLGIATPVALVASDLRGGPALFGFLRPRLLVPRSFLSRDARAQLRYVILHELAHFKRGDIPVNWILTLIQTLHWFNPVVWYAFYRMRADREVACDALALRYLNDDEASEYGLTILSLFESTPRMRAVPGAVGILEDKRHLKRRIAMIADFSKATRGRSLAAVALIAILCVVGLSNAPAVPATGQDAPAPIVPVLESPVKPSPSVVPQVPAVEPIAGQPTPLDAPRPAPSNVKVRVDLPAGMPTPQPSTWQVAVPANDQPDDPEIVEALKQRASVDFAPGMSLANAIESIRENSELNILLDKRAVRPESGQDAAAGGDENADVTDGIISGVQLNDVPLKSVLEGLLRPLNLDYAIREGFIFVSSPQLLMAEGLKPQIGTRPSHAGMPIAAFRGTHQSGLRFDGPFPAPSAVPGSLPGSPRPPMLTPLPAMPPANAIPGVPLVPEAGNVESVPENAEQEESIDAPEPPVVPESIEIDDEAKLEIEGKLDKTISLEIEDMHVTSLAKQLANYADLNIVVDNRVVRPARGGGEPGKDYVTDGFVPLFKVDDVPLRDALSAMMKQLNLVYTVQPDFIWITSPDNAAHESFEEMETRWYRMDDGMDRAAAAELVTTKVWKDMPPLRDPAGKQLSMAYLAEDDKAFGVQDVPTRLDKFEAKYQFERIPDFEPSKEYVGYMPYINEEDNLSYGWFHKSETPEGT